MTHPVNQAIRLTDGTFYGADPHPPLRWMRENAPVYWDAAGEVWASLATRTCSRSPRTR